MTEKKRVLILCLDSPATEGANRLANALTELGAIATIGHADARCNYEQILDSIALADTVICWR